jgi:hypothetical protein
MTEFSHGQRVAGQPGEIISINGLHGKFVILAALYDYDRDGCRCPSCGGVGFAWAGWYDCDGDPACYVKAFIPTGEMFLPLANGREVK